MYTYILVRKGTNLDVQTINGMYWYILVCTDHITGFRGRHCNAAMLEEPGPSVESEHGGAGCCPRLKLCTVTLYTTKNHCKTLMH